MILKPDVDYELHLMVVKKPRAGAVLEWSDVLGHCQTIDMRNIAESIIADEDYAKNRVIPAFKAVINKYLRDWEAEKAEANKPPLIG